MSTMEERIFEILKQKKYQFLKNLENLEIEAGT